MAWTTGIKWLHPQNWDENPPPMTLGADQGDSPNRLVPGNGGFRDVTVQLTGESDGAAEESAVKKVDISELRTSRGLVPIRTSIRKVKFATTGLNFIRLEWDRQDNKEIALIPGADVGAYDYKRSGGNADPNPGDNNGIGNTGDILLTTDGAADGSNYNLELTIRLKDRAPSSLLGE
jgi:hypothetical protein